MSAYPDWFQGWIDCPDEPCRHKAHHYTYVGRTPRGLYGDEVPTEAQTRSARAGAQAARRSGNGFVLRISREGRHPQGCECRKHRLGREYMARYRAQFADHEPYCTCEYHEKRRRENWRRRGKAA